MRIQSKKCIRMSLAKGSAAEKDRLSHIMAFGEDPLARRGPLKPDAKSLEPQSPTPEKDRFEECVFETSPIIRLVMIYFQLLF